MKVRGIGWKFDDNDVHHHYHQLGRNNCHSFLSLPPSITAYVCVCECWCLESLFLPHSTTREAELCVRNFANSCVKPFARQYINLLISGPIQVLRKRCTHTGIKSSSSNTIPLFQSIIMMFIQQSIWNTSNALMVPNHRLIFAMIMQLETRCEYLLRKKRTGFHCLAGKFGC